MPPKTKRPAVKAKTSVRKPGPSTPSSAPPKAAAAAAAGVNQPTMRPKPTPTKTAKRGVRGKTPESSSSSSSTSTKPTTKTKTTTKTTNNNKKAEPKTKEKAPKKSSKPKITPNTTTPKTSTPNTVPDHTLTVPPQIGPPPAGPKEKPPAAAPLPPVSQKMSSFCTSYRPPPGTVNHKLKKDGTRRTGGPGRGHKGPQKKKEEKKKDDPTLPPPETFYPPKQPENSGPQVEIGPDGRIMVKESSLEIGGQSRQPAEDYEEVTEDATMTATYASFTSRSKTAGWGAEETRKFYVALRRVGQNFNMMAQYFPNRDRKQLLKKFKAEEKKRPDLVEMSLDKKVRENMGINIEDGVIKLNEITTAPPATNGLSGKKKEKEKEGGKKRKVNEGKKTTQQGKKTKKKEEKKKEEAVPDHEVEEGGDAEGNEEMWI